MQQIPKTAFCKLTREGLKDIIPVEITLDGEVIGAFVDPNEIIYIGDLHPYVRNSLKAKEALARSGMPKN